MARKTIAIIGPIGSFKYQGQEVHGVELADVVARVSSLPQDTTELEVQYDTPGGVKDTGMAIYNYLKSIQPRIKVISRQIGDIGSIGTYAWFSGSERIAMKGKKFMAHNPWTVTEGDADSHQRQADSLKQAEEEMIAFYSEQTGITREGIAPLMKAEYAFGDDRAVELKFATSLEEGSLIAAYKPEFNTMEKNMIKGLVDEIKAFIKGGNQLAMMVVELEGGTKISIDAPDASNLIGAKAYTVDATGNPTQVPAPDGDHKLTDGRVVTVAGGAISKIAEAPAGEDSQMTALAASVKDLLEAVKSQNQSKDDLKATVKEVVAEEIKNFKKTIKTEHTPEGFTPETSADDVKEWDRSFKANEHMAMKKNDPDKYKRLFYAKYGKLPNL